MLGVTLRLTSIPSMGGVEMLLVASRYRNWNKVLRYGPLGPTQTLHVSLPNYRLLLLLFYFGSLQTTN